MGAGSRSGTSSGSSRAPGRAHRRGAPGVCPPWTSAAADAAETFGKDVATGGDRETSRDLSLEETRPLTDFADRVLREAGARYHGGGGEAETA